MDKLSLTCACGQEMVVPSNALGRSGLCPGCGGQVNITAENTQTYRPRRRPAQQRAVTVRPTETSGESASREDAWRNFAAAVDLYNTRRYAEALTLLNTLLRQFPGNEHVESARDQCLEALQRITLSGHTYDGRAVDDAVLSADLVKSMVLDKMLRGSSEEVQLRATELAARLLGMLERGEKDSLPEEEQAPSPALVREESVPSANGHAPVRELHTVEPVRWRKETRRFVQALAPEPRNGHAPASTEAPGQGRGRCAW